MTAERCYLCEGPSRYSNMIFPNCRVKQIGTIISNERQSLVAFLLATFSEFCGRYLINFFWLGSACREDRNSSERVHNGQLRSHDVRIRKRRGDVLVDQGTEATTRRTIPIST